MTEITGRSWNADHSSTQRRFFFAVVSLAIASAIWLPSIHFIFVPTVENYYREAGISPIVRELVNQHLKLWNDPQLREKEISRMRGSNAEWDFMGRTFLVLALANLGLRDREGKADYLQIIDRIIDETIRLEKEKSFYFFLMGYSRTGNFIASPARSIFVDGEIALMIGARRIVEERTDYKPLLRERVDAMQFQMMQSPVLCGESYPDECWIFCNSIALVAMRVYDVLDGQNHDDFIQEWLSTAKSRLVENSTGLLVSSLRLNGTHGDGPEGSTIWLVVHCLQLLDEAFARDQYQRARKELFRSLGGFGYASEWPKSCKSGSDIDSGPIIPVLELSAGSTGLAFLGAATFGDTEFLKALIMSLELGAFPIRKDGCLRYAGSNQVGDAVLLYALTTGPLWKEIKTRMRK